MIICKLECNIQGDDWDRLETYFFKTKDEAEAFKEQYEKEHTKADGSYIPTISSIHYGYTEDDFNNFKDEMTVADYEELFNMDLKPNNKLSLDDLETGMFVWNKTQSEYQRVRCIRSSKFKSYHWCGNRGNIIMNDELYNYKLH